MERPTSPTLTRRAILRAWLALPAAGLLAACTGAATGTPTTTGQTRTTDPTATTAPPAASATIAPTQAAATQPPTAVATAATATPAATPAAATATTTTAAAATRTAAPSAAAAAAPALTPTPSCADDDDDPTPAQTEGPYFTRNSPERASLREPGMAGTKLVITGRVLTTGCQPVARALIDVWQADDRGQYDNVGYRLRGHLFTDAQGRYSLETIVPGLYPGRTRHIHVKVQAPGRPVLTTQLYFPGEARNRTDNIYSAALLLAVQDTADGKAAQFDFVLDL